MGWGLWGDAHPNMHILGQVFPVRGDPSPSATGVSPLCAHPRAWHPPWRQAGPGRVHVPSVAGTPVHPPPPCSPAVVPDMGAPKGHHEAMRFDTPLSKPLSSTGQEGTVPSTLALPRGSEQWVLRPGGVQQ